MLILSAPSGTGKTTLANKILQKDKHITLSTSYTTRVKRPGEVDGVHYYFKTKELFKKQIKNKEFLEYAKIFGEFYGTPKKEVLHKLDNGKDVLFDINWQGHRQLVSIARPDVTSVFLLPPSKEELLKRLEHRNQDKLDVIKQRMYRLDEEISHWDEYDYIIINKDINQSMNKLMSILKSERLKKERRIGLSDFTRTLMNHRFIR